MKKYKISFTVSSLGLQENEVIECFNENEAKNFIKNKVIFLLENITQNKKERVAFMKELCYNVIEVSN